MLEKNCQIKILDHQEMAKFEVYDGFLGQKIFEAIHQMSKTFQSDQEQKMFSYLGQDQIIFQEH